MNNAGTMTKIQKTYYYKDRDHRLKTIYVLILNGEKAGEVRTKREAQDWFAHLTTDCQAFS